MKERWQRLGVASALLGQLPCFVCVFVRVFVLFLFFCFSSVVFGRSCAFGSHLAFAVVAFGCLVSDPTRTCGGCFWLFGSGSHSHLRWLLFRVWFVDSSCAAPAVALVQGWFPRALALAVPRAPSLTGFGVCPREPRWTGQCQWLKVS